MRIGTGLTAISTLLVACGFPQPSAVPIDAAPVDAAPDAVVVPPNTVIGRSKNTCLQGSASVVRPADLSATVIKALIPDAGSAAGYRVVVGAGSSDGTFIIHDVPDGVRYVLQFNNTYFETTSHDLDNGGIVPARCEPAPVLTTMSTPITFALSGLSEFRPGDALTATSLSLGVEDDMAPTPTYQTAGNVVTDWFLDPFSVLINASPALVDQSIGDDLTLLHQRLGRHLGSDGRFESVQAIVDIGAASGAAMTDGSASTIPVAFTAVPPAKQLTLAVNRSSYDSAFDPLTAEAGMEVDVVAQPIATDVGWGEYLLLIPLDDWSGSAGLQHVFKGMPYADPFPVAWHRYMAVNYERQRAFAMLGAASFVNRAGSSLTTDLPTTPAAKTDNIVALPTNITLAGVPFAEGGLVHFDGVTPVTLAWGGVATARQYLVQVLAISVNNGRTRSKLVARLTTDQTSLRIPAQVFGVGQSFAFTLSAIDSPTDYSAGHLVPNGTPGGTMATPSGLFLFSATCGDGVVDTGEQCDGSGETAQCDVDCSKALCGDGLRNAAAGEACDTVVDTPGCNGSGAGSNACQAPVCGDGYVNTAVEDCDFGSANGSATDCDPVTCRHLHRCGDGVMSGPEACDPGSSGSDSSTCNFDCTKVVCGDSYINAAAGEQCDDGFGQNGTDGHCGSDCKRL